MEIETSAHATAYRILRQWNNRKCPPKISDPTAPLEQRIDVSPSVLFNREERDYAGASIGHPAGYFLGIVVPALALLYTGGTALELAVATFLAGMLVVLATFNPGNAKRAQEIVGAKERVRAAEQMQFRNATRRIDWWKSLSGVEFENAIARLFCDWGYEVMPTPYSGDGGVDLILCRNGKRGLVQCKAYDGKVGVAAVRELIGASQLSDVSEIWLVSLFGFSKGARDLASKSGVRLYSVAENYLGIVHEAA